MKSQRAFRLSFVVHLVLSTCAFAQAADLRVGVYGGTGQKGILDGLADVKGIEAGPLANFSASSLSGRDVIVWPHGRLATGDRTRLWRVLLKEYVGAGGGLVLTHDAAGGAGPTRGDMGKTPLFPDVARSPGYPARREKLIFRRAPGVEHALGKALPEQFAHAYSDHMALMTGPDGTTVMVDEDGDPVVVAGQFGKGRVVIMGNLPGYKGTKTYGPAGLGKVADEGPTTAKGGELRSLVESIRWAGEPFGAKPMAPAKLEAALEGAVDRAAPEAGTDEREAIRAFGDAVAGNFLDPNIWEYARKGPNANKWGTWYGHGIIGPPYNMFLETGAVNQPITTRRFEKSPLTGRFLFTGEAILSPMFAGILEWRIIDETANKDIRDGYGFRLVYGGIEEKTPGYAFRKDSKERQIKIGSARHAIFKITRGKVTQLATVEAPGRLMAPKEGERRVPIRFERIAEGVLRLSIDGLVVARVKDQAYDTFTKLRAVMTTPGGRLGFDAPTLIGYFAKQEETRAPAPWIVPEPKEMERTGESFALCDGAQFVVSDRKKIETYLLDEWIIPELKGYYGITMKAVTVAEMDSSKPAIYLDESSDPAFAKLFDPRLKAIGETDPGPEGYALLVTRGAAQAAGATERGTFWALQSLVQLIARDGDRVAIRGAQVKDWPDLQLRGSVTSLWARSDGIQSNTDRALTCVRMFARYKANALIIGGKYFKFPSYDLSGYGCQWSFQDLIDIYRLCDKYHIEVIPLGYSLCHAGLRVSFYLSRTNPKLWKWIVENKVLADDLSDKGHHSADSFNATSPHAWEMCRKLNQDFIDISPNSRFLLTPFDEINPPIHSYAPEGTEDDLLVEWIRKCHEHLKENGRRMIMWPSYVAEAAKFPGSSASLGRTDAEGMPVSDIAGRIPKDIIMADWYYGTSPDRAIYKHLKDKGFEVLAVPGPCYGYSYESVYHAAVEGKKAGILGIFGYGYDFGAYINPQQTSYPLPWMYGWTVPGKLKPGWAWQERWQDVFQGPLPSHTGEVVPLDISAACNESRADDKAEDGAGWLDYGKLSDLRGLPAGEIGYRQYRFSIVDEATNDGKSVIVVSRRKGEKIDEAGRATGIPVGGAARSLVFLHTGTSLGAAWVSGFCAYRVNYQDGTSARLPIKYGHQIGPWIYSADTGHPRLNNFYRKGYLSWCRLIETGRTAMGEKTGLYVYEWVNPHPERKIATIDMEASVDRNVRAALVGLSAVR